MPKKDILSLEMVNFDPTNPELVPDIEQIVRWSTRESMVSISKNSIGGHQMGVAAYASGTRLDGNVLAGYGAITNIYSRNVVELGGLVTNPRIRGLGVGSHLVKRLVQRVREELTAEQILAFSNYSSATLFAKLGGIQIENANESLPPEVWKLCHLCRFYDDAQSIGDQCCGRVFDITNIEVGPDE